MFAHLSNAVRIECGKLIATLVDPAARVLPHCLSKKGRDGVDTDSLENGLKLFQLIFKGFVHKTLDVINMCLRIVKFQQCCFTGCLADV